MSTTYLGYRKCKKLLRRLLSLASKRASAFYQEVDYDEETAKEVMASAEKVLAFGREFIQMLRSQ